MIVDRRCKAEWYRNRIFTDDNIGEVDIQKINSEVEKEDNAQTLGTGVCPTTGSWGYTAIAKQDVNHIHFLDRTNESWNFISNHFKLL